MPSPKDGFKKGPAPQYRSESSNVFKVEKYNIEENWVDCIEEGVGPAFKYYYGDVEYLRVIHVGMRFYYENTYAWSSRGRGELVRTQIMLAAAPTYTSTDTPSRHRRHRRGRR